MKGTDYTVAYSNNTNAALSTATENAPTVIITAVATLTVHVTGSTLQLQDSEKSQSEADSRQLEW